MTPAATLRAAARYLARYGWIQGSHYELSARVFTPPACVVGAIAMVCYGGPVECPAYQYDEPGFDDFQEALSHLDWHLEAHRYLEPHWLIEEAGYAYSFNDTKGRTADEVIRVLHDAADEWDRAFLASASELARVLGIQGGDRRCHADLLLWLANTSPQEKRQGWLGEDPDDECDGDFVESPADELDRVLRNVADMYRRMDGGVA
ncbi:MAG TPA: hypothetical protein VFC19_36415 [Candidatus Limnocylindrales bacterium]|nr:hypothetical protein [Candidatus Limnocylindrales bacterium]